VEEATTNKGEEEGARSSQMYGKERPPPIIITTQINLLRFQGYHKR
jgi:hypothetical protein